MGDLRPLDAQLTRERAATDQLREILKDAAKCAGTYYQALIQEGIPKELAKDFVTAWHDSYWDIPDEDKDPLD